MRFPHVGITQPIAQKSERQSGERAVFWGASFVRQNERELLTKRGEEAFIAKERKDSSFRVMDKLVN